MMWTYNLISNKYLPVKQLFLTTLQCLSLRSPVPLSCSLLSAHTRAGAPFLAGPDFFLGNCYDQVLLGMRTWHLPQLCCVGPSAHLGSSCTIPWSGIPVGAAHSWCLLPLPTQSQSRCPEPLASLPRAPFLKGPWLPLGAFALALSHFIYAGEGRGQFWADACLPSPQKPRSPGRSFRRGGVRGQGSRVGART